MLKRKLKHICIASLFVCAQSQAALIGVFGDSTSQAIDVAEEQGFLTQLITDFSE